MQSTTSVFTIGMSTQKRGGEFTNQPSNKNDAYTHANLTVTTKEKRNEHAQVKFSPQYEN